MGIAALNLGLDPEAQYSSSPVMPQGWDSLCTMRIPQLSTDIWEWLPKKIKSDQANLRTSLYFCFCHSFVCKHTHSRRRQWHPTPVLLPGKSHRWRSLVGFSPWGRYKSDSTERLHFHFSLSCIGGGNGNPLQNSCLENPRDGGAWWAAVHEVSQSWTRLKRLSSSSSSSTVTQAKKQESQGNWQGVCCTCVVMQHAWKMTWCLSIPERVGLGSYLSSKWFTGPRILLTASVVTLELSGYS